MIIEHDFEMPVDDDLFTSIFNTTKKDIIIAKQCFKLIYGAKKLKELNKCIKTGIMEIFDYKDTDERVLFTLIISQLGNQRRS